MHKHPGGSIRYLAHTGKALPKHAFQLQGKQDNGSPMQFANDEDDKFRDAVFGSVSDRDHISAEPGCDGCPDFDCHRPSQ